MSVSLDFKNLLKVYLRSWFHGYHSYLQRNSTDGFSKSDEEPGVENRMVLCSAKDEYVLQQDVCVMCGAFGCDLEGRLISCAQCGQCYHPYCVNIKVRAINFWP
jgi:histone-lysine N-methyltransferase MLL3